MSPNKQKNIKFCTTDKASEDNYVSQQAEKYHVKVAESNLSAESFDHQRYMIGTKKNKHLLIYFQHLLEFKDIYYTSILLHKHFPKDS